MEINKTEKSLDKIKEKKSRKFLDSIKKRWLIDSTSTILLIAIIITIFIAINVALQKMELTPIDFSQDKLYSLSNESKERVKNIQKDVNIYFVGYSEDNHYIDLAKQYKKVNERIIVEAVDINNRPDLAKKYDIPSDSQGIIIECEQKSKVLTENDLVTYDMTTYETIDIAEEKFTSSISSVASEFIPKVYFLEGYSDFSLSNNMQYLSAFMQNEINEVNTLNVLSVGKIPDDCDTLVILTPSKDFDDIATNAILDYINLGKNILWLNAAQTRSMDLPNVNKILSLYGVNPFEIGIIRETDDGKMAMGSQDVIMPEVQYSSVLKDVSSGTGAIFINTTKINIDDSKLYELKVEKTDLMLASEKSYFRSNFNIKKDEITEEDQKGEFLVGVLLEKTIQDADEENDKKAIKSKLIIYGENYFASDAQIIPNSYYTAIQLAQNKDVVLNSIAYLVDRPEDIVARKSTGQVTYTATEKQDKIIRITIFSVPAIIILIGIIVWIKRKNKK